MKAATGSKSANEWATLAAGAVSAFEKQNEIGLTAFVDRYAKNEGVGSSTMWRHVGAYLFWTALREQGDYGELPPAEKVQVLVSSNYMCDLRQFAQTQPFATKRKFIHAIRDGQPIDASAFAGASRPLARGRGAGAKNIQRMQGQPDFDAASLTRAIMERLPTWSAAERPADAGGHVLAAELGTIPERLGRPDAVFFMINDAQADDEQQLIQMGALTLIPPDAPLGEQMTMLALAQCSMNIGQSWVGFSQPPDSTISGVAKDAGMGVLLCTEVEGDVRVDVLATAKPVAANPYLRDLVLSKFLLRPGSVVLIETPKEPKASGGPKMG